MILSIDVAIEPETRDLSWATVKIRATRGHPGTDLLADCRDALKGAVGDRMVVSGSERSRFGSGWVECRCLFREHSCFDG